MTRRLEEVTSSWWLANWECRAVPLVFSKKFSCHGKWSWVPWSHAREKSTSVKSTSDGNKNHTLFLSSLTPAKKKCWAALSLSFDGCRPKLPGPNDQEGRYLSLAKVCQAELPFHFYSQWNLCGCASYSVQLPLTGFHFCSENWVSCLNFNGMIIARYCSGLLGGTTVT